ncbi:MAG TPA: LLM class flavin-dependent oxidoreductase, partial [Phototrophicaceae bacterium]|nr:LLM class flavin-dependent oxidoreductase [Phototrophicaceae bacterium]
VDPWVALAAIAMTPNRVKIGALVTPIPRRRPWKLARETVSLDHLSGGRLIFGAGLGSGRADEWENLGEERDPVRRGTMLDEGLDVLAGLWTGETFNYNGQHYQVKDTRFIPAPVQQPRIPVWIAAYWPHKKPMRRAARWDGLFALFSPGGVGELQEFSEAAAFIRDEREKQGMTGAYDVVYRGIRGANESHAQWAKRAAQFEAAGANWWLEHLMPQMFGGDWGHWPLEAMRERIIEGPPR